MSSPRDVPASSNLIDSAIAKALLVPEAVSPTMFSMKAAEKPALSDKPGYISEVNTGLSASRFASGIMEPPELSTEALSSASKSALGEALNIAWTRRNILVLVSLMNQDTRNVCGFLTFG